MVTVYLDTQHISRAASGRNGLAQYFGHPGIQFFYSASHVVECLPKEATENAAAKECLRLIMGLGARHLVSWVHVTEAERSRKECELEDLACARKSQMLFPGYKVSRAEWNKKVRDALKALLLERFPDQNVRRSWQAKLLKNGKLTPKAFEFLRGQHKQGAESISREMPPAEPLMSDGALYDFLEGRISEENFTEKFMSALADPVSLGQLSSLPGCESILDLSRIFWTEMERIVESLSRLVRNLLAQQAGRAGVGYQKLRSEIARYVGSADFRSAVGRRFCGPELSPVELDTMPGTRLLVDAFGQYVLEIADRYVNQNSPEYGVELRLKRSDMADFTHLSYMPYVDIFGCDGAMRDRVRRAGWSIENIVTSDSELEQRLSEIPRLD